MVWTIGVGIVGKMKKSEKPADSQPFWTAIKKSIPSIKAKRGAKHLSHALKEETTAIQKLLQDYIEKNKNAALMDLVSNKGLLSDLREVEEIKGILDGRLESGDFQGILDTLTETLS